MAIPGVEAVVQSVEALFRSQPQPDRLPPDPDTQVRIQLQTVVTQILTPRIEALFLGNPSAEEALVDRAIFVSELELADLEPLAPERKAQFLVLLDLARNCDWNDLTALDNLFHACREYTNDPK